MKKIIKYISAFVATFMTITAVMPASASAHSLTAWANIYTKNKAGGNYHFAIGDVYHVDGNNVNYYWANNTTKKYFSDSMLYGVGLWNGMISATETTSANAHMKVTYNPNIGDALAYVVCYEPSYGHYSPNETTTEMVLGNITGNSQKHKSEIIRHELGHVWGIDDLYDVNTTLESIYSQGDKYDYPTRHDKNALRIGLNNPWFYNSDGTRKYQKSPGVWAKNETLNINGDSYKFDSNGILEIMNIANGIYKIQGKTSSKSVSYTSSNNSAVLYQSSVSNNQKFRFERQNDGTYKITSLSANKVLDTGTDSTSGIEVQFNSWNGGNNQKWYIVDCGNGWVKFINKYAGLVLDIENNGISDGTPIQQYEDADVNAQRFKLIKQNIPEHTNTGAKGFTTAGSWFDTSTRDRVWPADVNGDGKTDLVGIRFDGQIEYALSNGSKSFQGVVKSSSNVFKTNDKWFDTTSMQRVWPADINGDGYDDFVGVAIDGRIYSSINNKNNTYSANTYKGGSGFTSSWFSNSYRQRVWPADIDGDGKMDLVGISNSGDVYWARSKGDGSFENTIAIGNKVFPTSDGWFSNNHKQRVWPADVNGDGKSDFVGIKVDGSIFTAINNGNNTFSSSTAKGGSGFTTSGHWFDTATTNRVWPADINGDGKMDLVGIRFDGQVEYALSNGNGIFQNTKPIDSYIFPTSGNWFLNTYKQRVWPTDVNGDGKTDFIGIAIAGYFYTAENLT